MMLHQNAFVAERFLVIHFCCRIAEPALSLCPDLSFFVFVRAYVITVSRVLV